MSQSHPSICLDKRPHHQYYMSMNPLPLPLPLKPLNILDLNAPAPDLVQETIQINGKPFAFFRPPGDDTMYGTLSCLQSNKFHLSDAQFSDGDVMVDIGSNIGLVGLVVAALFPKVRVYAFDASDLAVRAARRSAAANGLTNYMAFNLAVGAQAKKDVLFYSNGRDKSCLVGEGLNSSNPVPELKVDMIAIDEIFDSQLLGIERVRYIKLDVEGQEFAIFKRLFESRPDILERIHYAHIEIHPYEQYDPKGLEDGLKTQFGSRVFFDT